MAEERLSKVMSARGLCSRREAEGWIRDGRVSVDGEVVREVVPVDPRLQDIRVDGKPLPPEPEHVYLLLYKPRGCITGRDDPHGRKSVFDVVGELPIRVEPVGRLDFDTEGALLLTNDGVLAHALTHPKNQVPKRYLAKVYRTPDERDLEALRTGVFLEDGRTAPALARIVDQTDTTNAWVEITVTEGRNRLVRRMFGKLGHPVSKLRRETFATLSIRGMERGQVRTLTGEELQRVRDIADGVRPQRAGGQRREGWAKAKPKPVRPNHRKKASRSKGRGKASDRGSRRS
jgi:pseudouridine synthase